jgi:glutathione S-transferase
LVPTIDDNGFVLWESNAIVRYLYTVHKPAASIQQNATEEQWMEWSRDVTDCVGLIFRQLIRTSPEQRDEASIQRAQIKADHLFSLLDAQLQSREYVAGKEFSKADIVVAVNAHRYFNLPISRPSLPNLEAWLRRVAQREGYKTYVAIPLT